MPHVVLDKAGDQDQSSGAQNLVDTHTHKQPDKCRDKGEEALRVLEAQRRTTD